MRILTWLLRLSLFLFMFIFALKNTAMVNLQFFFGQVWQLPLVVLLLGFFAVGVLLGILAVVGALFRERRVSAGLRRELARLAPASLPEPVREP
ncbi:lipopolysaccharide assembly LapA domain-containing protein [Azovibrio restrictus]|uniref:LapA family protein n=1 Tax=Azovibrio restrictus TaxID=146938 RepID=UPI0026E93788|nr:LapA family protein [Azovibrio restrictus]